MRNFKLWQSIVQEVSNAPMAFVKFVCCVYATKTFLVDVTYCPGPSMLPTMNTSGSGDLVLADRLSPLLGRIGRGDIVVVRSPENPRKLITKRIIAMENDSITFLVDPQNSDKSESVVVPKGHVWIQGDNIYASRDSRDFGPVPYGLIYGKVFWRVVYLMQWAWLMWWYSSYLTTSMATYCALLSAVLLGGRILGGMNLLLHRNDFCQQALLADVSCGNTYSLVTRFSFYG